MENTASQGKPLNGIRVLAVEHFRAGPTASMLLADAGAEVIKIEPLGEGEAGRAITIVNKQGLPIPFLITSLSRNKKSVTLNLRAPKGKKLFERLVSLSDVIVENMRAGIMNKLGLGYLELSKINPRLIYASISGYGHSDIYQGPYTTWPAFDPLAQSMSGYMYSTGREDDPPHYSSSIVADTVPPILAAFGIMLALHQRASTGMGQHVDISMYDSMVFLNNYRISCAAIREANIPRRIVSSGPGGPFKAKDGYFTLAVMPNDFKLFCKLIGRDDLASLPELLTGEGRATHQETTLRPAIEEWARDKAVEEICRILRDHDVPVAPVQDELAVLSCPHLKARKMIVKYETPFGSEVVTVGNPIKLSRVPEDEPSPPPAAGQHTRQILEELLGHTEEQIDELHREGII